MELRNFLADFLCVLLPLFVVDAWQIRKAKSSSAYPSPYALALVFLISSIIASLFNFPLATDIHVNLSIVPLTIVFYLLSWRLGLIVTACYVISEIILGYFTRTNGHIELARVNAVLHVLPRALVIVAIYFIVMSLAALIARRQTRSRKILTFIAALVIFSIVEYAHVASIAHLTGPVKGYLITYVLIINVTFVLSLHLVNGVQNAHERRVADLRADRLQLIGQLSASVAHEVRNPITVVKGFTQLMLSYDYGREKSVEFMESMLSELDRAESIISNYLQLARTGDVDKSQIRKVNLLSVIEYAIQILSPYASVRSVEIKRDFNGEATVAAEPDILGQAIINVIKNGIEAHEQSGTVTISVHGVDRRVTVAVTDTGRGIPASEIAHLGEPYYSTKATGTGLGLTFVYKTIHDAGGFIEVKSREGHGTKFIITLPRILNAAMQYEMETAATVAGFDSNRSPSGD